MVGRIETMLKRQASLVPRSVVMTAAGSLLLALPCLSACGQKGPLILAAPAAPASAALPSQNPVLPLPTPVTPTK
jgi:predicted small lipoprotein YifL